MHEYVVTLQYATPAADAALVDHELGRFNEHAAPLHEVSPLACFARTPSGDVIAGAVGRTWGACCELQQLWVKEEHRRSGVATALMRSFESAAMERGCRVVYLETFSFQAPTFYRGLGYEIKLEISGFSEGVAKYTMLRELQRHKSNCRLLVAQHSGARCLRASVWSGVWSGKRAVNAERQWLLSRCA